MSNLTQTHQFLIRAGNVFLAAASVCFSVSVALASDLAVDSAQSELSRAYGDYYKSARTGALKGAADRDRLQEKLLAPARGKVLQAMYDGKAKVIEESTSKVEPKDVDSSESEKESPKSRGPASFSIPSSREEVVIDGSDVPKELDFPGTKK